MLRGINVSGQKKIKMDDLKSLYIKRGQHQKGSKTFYWFIVNPGPDQPNPLKLLSNIRNKREYLLLISPLYPENGAFKDEWITWPRVKYFYAPVDGLVRPKISRTLDGFKT